MKTLPLFALLLLTFSQCKRNDPDPLPEVASIAGKWRVVTYSRMLGDSLIIEPATKENATFYEFRYDGVIVNEKGFMPCCLPQTYTLNGNRFEAKPLSPAKPDPSCIFVDCAPCAELKITTPASNTLKIETCNNFTMLLVPEQ